MYHWHYVNVVCAFPLRNFRGVPGSSIDVVLISSILAWYNTTIAIGEPVRKAEYLNRSRMRTLLELP